MCPGHFEAAEDDGRDDRDDGSGDPSAGSEIHEQAEEELVDHVGYDCDMKAAEARPRPSFLAEVANCCADFGSNGFRFDEEEFRFGGRGLLDGFLIGGEERGVGLLRLDRVDCKSSGCRGFNHGESCHDGAISVTDLMMGSVREAGDDPWVELTANMAPM